MAAISYAEYILLQSALAVITNHGPNSNSFNALMQGPPHAGANARNTFIVTRVVVREQAKRSLVLGRWVISKH